MYRHSSSLPTKGAAQQHEQRGFTLVELMVAMTGSLFFTVFVFMLSRDVGRFFQAQSRTSDTTLTALTGFERLRQDIARAGFLASPNLSRDQNRCPRSSLGAAAVAPNQVGTQFNSFPGLQQMGILGIDASPAALTNLDFYATLNNAKLAPQVLTLYGSYTASEEFPIKSFDKATTIRLKDDSEALRRVGISTVPTPTSDADGTAILQRIFRPGSLLRMTDSEGRQQYAVVDDVAYSSGEGTITLSADIDIQSKTAGNTCGYKGAGKNSTVNPVNIIRYEIAQVKPTASTNHPQLQFLYEGAAPSYDDDTRFDLMRYEVPPNLARNATITGVNWPGTSAKITATGEMIAAYAVDLAFGLTVMSDYETGKLTTYGEGDANIANYAGNPLDAPTAGGLSSATATRGPHFIRGVHARLAVRYREADREGSILPDPGDDSVTASQILRVKVADGNKFARTRSLRSYVSTRNTRSLTW